MPKFHIPRFISYLYLYKRKNYIYREHLPRIDVCLSLLLEDSIQITLIKWLIDHYITDGIQRLLRIFTTIRWKFNGD